MFSELDHSRVEYILRTSHRFALSYGNFFKKNQKAIHAKILLAKDKHVKFRNTPTNTQEAIKIIMRLPENIKPIFLEYLLSLPNIKPDDYVESPGWVQDVIKEFKKTEEDKEYELNKEKEHGFCTLILLELLKQNPDNDLIEFMKSPIHSINNYTAGHSSEVASQIGKINKTNEIKKNEKMKANKTTPSSIITAKELKSDIAGTIIQDIMEDRLRVIVKELFKTTKIYTYEPVALIVNDVIQAINYSDLGKIFPSKGQIICFENKHKPGRFLTASIESLHTPGIHEYQIDKFIDNGQYEEIVDSGSNSIESLRNFMLSNENTLAEKHALIKYNELIIRPVYATKKINFTVAFDTFSNITIHKIDTAPQNNYLLVPHLSVKREPDGHIDISDSFSRIKKILKKSYGKDSKWNKSQINDLINQIEENKDSQVDLDFSMLKTIIYSEDQANELVRLLLATPLIEEQVKKGIDTKINLYNNDSELLTQRELKLEEERKNFEETHKAKLLEFENEMKAIFNKEVLTGKEAMSKIALYSALLGGSSQKIYSNSEPRYQFKSITHAECDYSKLNELLPVPKTILDHMYDLIDDARSLSLLPIINGPSAPFFSKLYAYNKKLNIDEYIIKNGLNYCPELDNLDLKSPEKISLVLNFDIAIFPLYAPYLCEKLVISGFEIDNTSKRDSLILISNNDGLNLDAVIPEALKYLTIQFDPINIDISTSGTENAYQNLEDAHIDDDEFKAKILKILQVKMQLIEDKGRRDKLASIVSKQLGLED